MKKTQPTNLAFYLGLLTIVLIFNSGVTAQTTSATLNFSGLQNDEEVREFYNGGAGSLGSTGGTNYGISFVNNYIKFSSGQVETAFTTPQLRNTIRGITINVPSGFGTAVSFRYKRIDGNAIDFCFVRAMSELTLGGTEVGRLILPATGAGGGFDTATSPLTNFTFSGTAKSLEFRCGGSHLAIDNITLNTAAAPPANRTLRIADFDGDGRTDTAVFRNGTWYINPSGSPSLTDAPSAAYAVQFGLATDKLVPADYDGDGKTDIAVWREGVRANFYILNSSNNTFRAEQFGTTGDNPVVVGNWDADGKADLAVYRNGASAGGQSFFFYRPSSQPGVDFETVYWGTAGDEAVRGDFDGDGRIDAAVFRASTGIWYIRQSSNNQPRYENWGTASDKRVSGDFDGDGKTDLAIFRDGLWAILQSSNNGQRYEQFGQTGDRIVAGDYDGDGKTDIAVFRNGIFYVRQSANSQSTAQPFGLAGDVPVAAAFVQ